MNKISDFKDPATQVLQKAYALLRNFAKTPFTNEGKQFLQLVMDSTHSIQRAMVNAAPADFSLEEEIFILEAMTSDSYEAIRGYFAIAAPDYGIEFCEKIIKSLKEQELRLILSTGVGFVKGSPQDIQMGNFKVMLERFKSEQKRGVEPSYNPKIYAQFA